YNNVSLSFPDLSLFHNQLSEPSSPSALYVFIQNIFKKIPFYICLLSPNALLLHPLSKRRTAFNFDMLQRRRTCLTE
ncbi:hypothetical protein, partial [Bacteroides fragilis]|uniref:hypothetical protein n=2 Tax=Bacteroides fragilis TaxID=817 RepID=UPI001E3CE004